MLRQLTTVRQSRQGIVMCEVVQLPRAFIHACFELSLILAHKCFCVLELARHFVERSSECVQFMDAAVNGDAPAALSIRDRPDGSDQFANRNDDAMSGRRRDEHQDG